MGCNREAEILALLEAIYERICTETSDENSKACNEYMIVLNNMRARGVAAIRSQYGI